MAKIEAKKEEQGKPITIRTYFKDYIDNKECRVLNFVLYGNSYGANYRTKKPARISIALSKEVCGENLKDLDNWVLKIIAIPRSVVFPEEDKEEKNNGN